MGIIMKVFCLLIPFLLIQSSEQKSIGNNDTLNYDYGSEVDVDYSGEMDSGDSSWDFSGIDKSGEIDSGEFDDEDFSGMDRSGEIDSGEFDDEDSAWDFSGMDRSLEIDSGEFDDEDFSGMDRSGEEFDVED